MGTRADFYVGRGEQAEWLGSIAYDGYPDGIDKLVLEAKTEDEFRAAVAAFLARETSATLPEMGWPWPWDNSKTTDYSYAFDDGRVWACGFGYRWTDKLFGGNENDWGWELSHKECAFPDMSVNSRPALGGPRSGVIILEIKG